MVIKRILFYVCFFFAAVSVVSVLTMLTAVILAASIFGMWKLTRNMTSDEINEMIGANWLNKKFNTNKNVYSKGIFEYKVSELINKEYEVKEIYNDTKNAVVDIGGVCKVKLTLSDTSYIRSIDVE